jgi:hypothetical protein
MGRSAHTAPLPASHTRPWVGDHETFMGEVSAVLESEPGDRALLERTLTDGYAHVLSLEAERWRVQRELRLLAASIGRDDTADKVKQLADLARRIEHQEDDLSRLRELLGRLRRQYTEAAEPATPRRARRSSAGR